MLASFVIKPEREQEFISNLRQFLVIYKNNFVDVKNKLHADKPTLMYIEFVDSNFHKIIKLLSCIDEDTCKYFFDSLSRPKNSNVIVLGTLLKYYMSHISDIIERVDVDLATLGKSNYRLRIFYKGVDMSTIELNDTKVPQLTSINEIINNVIDNNNDVIDHKEAIKLNQQSNDDAFFHSKKTLVNMMKGSF